MFQEYALFPHRDVAGNVEFGLRMTARSDGRGAARSTRCSISSGWAGSRTARVATLSGGEQQRVAHYGVQPQFVADTTGGVVRFNFGSPYAKPERLLDVEVGAKLQEGSAQFGADVYWMEFTDELVESGQVDIFGQPVTGNADRTRHVGLELEGFLPLGAGWSLGGNVTWSSNRLIRYSVIDDSLTRVSLDGNPIAGFPDILGNLRCTYETGAFTLSLSGKYVGSFYTDNYKNPANRNDAYLVWNGQLRWRLPERRRARFHPAVRRYQHSEQILHAERTGKRILPGRGEECSLWIDGHDVKEQSLGRIHTSHL